jgi:uncharacterized repeat protein (TIGR01451 family)
MKRYVPLGIALCLGAVLQSGVSITAATGVTFSIVTTAISNPVGIDWLPAGPYADQLVLSYNYGDGLPYNFTRLNRYTGAAASWGTQSGWNNEIYFATVRLPQATGGWVVGDMFSAQGNLFDGPPGFTGTGDVTKIARFAADGSPVNLNFATLPGETKLKRGGVTFDHFGVAGYDLIVIASNDAFSAIPSGPSDVYRVSSSGSVTHLATLAVHLEGVTTIPNDQSFYGPWAGKILAAAEDDNQLWTIDPVTGATQAYGTSELGLGIIKGEDLWVIPDKSTFYGVEIGDVSQVNRIWKVDTAQWTSMIGQVLLAQEYNGQLITIRWDAAANSGAGGFVTNEIYGGSLDGVGGPGHWEHITFAPDAASLGDFVWLDKNGDGQQDSGEPGIAGVTVNLLDSSGTTLLQTTTTSASGLYAFSVVPGTYVVQFLTPAGGYDKRTVSNTGADATDSDANPASGKTGQYTLTAGQVDSTVDAGLLPIDLSITKSVDNGAASVGTNVVFTIGVSNASDGSTATSVTVKDALPAGLSYVSSTASQGSYSSGTKIWTVGTLAPGGSATLAITATVTASGPKTNLAQVQTADQFDRDSTPGNAPGVHEDDDASVILTNPEAPHFHTVTLRKVLTPSTDTGRFDLTINATTVPNQGNGGQVQAANVLVGSTVSVSEAANVASGATLASYTSTLVCPDTNLPSGRTTSGSFTMPDVDVTCTVTNQRTGTPFTTFTQGGWGAPPNGNNPGALLAANFATVYPTGVAIGGTKKLKFTSAAAIEAYLPAGGKPAVLPASAPSIATNPTSSPAGVLGGQVLALQLNVDFSIAGLTKPGLPALKVASGKLAGLTVQQVLALANAVLGGNTAALTPYSMTVSQLNEVVTAINENFDDGKINGGFLVP